MPDPPKDATELETDNDSLSDSNPDIIECEFDEVEQGSDMSMDDVTFRDEVAEAFGDGPQEYVIDERDGLPNIKEINESPNVAIPFTVETVVCIEDDSQAIIVAPFKFVTTVRRPDVAPLRAEDLVKVIGISDEILVSDEFNRKPDEYAKAVCSLIDSVAGLFLSFRRDENGNPKQPLSKCGPSSYSFDGHVWERAGHIVPGSIMVLLEPKELVGTGSASTRSGELGCEFVLAVPIRQRCKHYKRQCVANDDIPDPEDFGHRLVMRNCMARRSIGGAFFSVRDEGIYACDYREPQDSYSIDKYLDSKDEERIREKRHLTKVPAFGVGR